MMCGEIVYNDKIKKKKGRPQSIAEKRHLISFHINNDTLEKIDKIVYELGSSRTEFINFILSEVDSSMLEKFKNKNLKTEHKEE